MAALNEQRNVFVVGEDEFHFDLLNAIRGAEQYKFHGLLSYSEVVRPEEYRVDRMLERAFERLDSFSGSIDAIVGYWDFPTSMMLPILRTRYGLPGPTLEAVLRCEHKYWSRLEQAKVIPEHIPRFFAVDPYDDRARQQIDLDYPFWIKPVKAHSSLLCFKIRNDQDFAEAIERIRREITLIAKGINTLLGHAQLPPEIAPVDGYHCIAEDVISAGQQCTLEGYVLDGEVVIYGAVDSIRTGRHRSSFSRYQYPSRLSRSVRDRMGRIATRIVKHVGLQQSPFNVEFFYDRDKDRISLLEINARISKSHSPLFLFVDGASHQQVMIEVAFGRDPHMPRREGRFRYGAKFMVRHLAGDAFVRHAPGHEDLRKLRETFPELRMRVHIRDGMRLSDMTMQEPYSYELADVFLGGNSQQEVAEEYRELKEKLPIDLDAAA